MLTETHTFTHTSFSSDVPEIKPTTIVFSTGDTSDDNNLTLQDMLDFFERYLVAVGYVVPEGAKVGLVTKE